MFEPGTFSQQQIELPSFLVVRISFGRKSVTRSIGQFISRPVDLLRGACEQVQEIPMDQGFDFLVALDRFNVLKTSSDEGEGRQNHRKTKRKDQPETGVAFSSFGLHCGAENTPDSAGRCQAQVKIC